jgi:hypothetical protein
MDIIDALDGMEPLDGFFEGFCASAEGLSLGDLGFMFSMAGNP